MPKPLFADIAVPTVPRDTLTYGVPEGLRGGLETGMRVVIPLGRRLLMGFVIRVHEHAPDFAVKAVQQVLDAEPVITHDVLELCMWISGYYCCSLGEALKAALPQGMDVDSERQISLRTNDELILLRAVGKSRIKRDILRALSTGEVISESALLAKVGVKSIAAQLRELYVEGILSIDTVLERPAARARMVLSVRLLPEWANEMRIAELMGIMEQRAPKQVNILTVLWQGWKAGERSMVMADLIKRSRASSAQVRALEDKEIVEIFEEELIRTYTPGFEERPKSLTLTEEQRIALSTIIPAVDEGRFRPMLLYGVTASGKTQVYIEAVRHALALGKSGLVLLPEIALTPQLAARFRQAFGDKAAVMHSRMSVGERYDAWRLTLRGDYRVVVGVRSAVFAPLRDLGIIIVDEEQDQSFKQSDIDPRYNGRDAAVMRARFGNIPVLLGSATPSVESWQNATSGKYSLLRLDHRIDDARMPAMTAVDMSEARRMRLVRGSLSRHLIEALRACMEKGEASIVFQNRRGFSPHVECSDCGYVEECENCSISLTFHKEGDALRCHYCGYGKKAPVICPRCGGTALDRVGSGTQRIEDELRQELPEARILRMDSDTTKRKGAHDLMLSAFSEGEYDILLGTQMVAKGLDFGRVTLVGIVSAEQSLLFPDFRSSERTVQMLTQVAGRAGRGTAPGTVIIQAAQPGHPVFSYVFRHDYEGFLATEMQSRRSLSYPPFTRMAALLFTSEKEDAAREAAEKYYSELKNGPEFFIMHPPQAALLSKINKRYRYQLILRVAKTADPDGSRLRNALRSAEEAYLRSAASRNVNITIDVDPQNLL
jgi:primosomal protein N' (replication factor Y) (superfamily II helicase)